MGELLDNSRQKINFTKEFLQDEYLNKRKSSSIIGKENNVSPTSVLFWLRKYEIPLRPQVMERANFRDLTGQKFNMLTVLEYVCRHSRYCTHIWLCSCDCGNKIHTETKSLVNGHTKSCGCLRGIIQDSKRVGELTNSHYSNIKYSAFQRGIDFNVTKEQLWDLFLKQERKCGISGLELTLKQRAKSGLPKASLDRIDNAKGYEISNCQWVHPHLNLMKQKFNQDYFADMCEHVSNYRNRSRYYG